MDESIKQQKEDLVTQIQEAFSLKEHAAAQYSPLALAYIGDGIYDLIIRTMVVERGNARANKLHHTVSGMVKASAQAKMMHKIEPILSEEEKAVYHRGRNAKSYTKAKNASTIDYRHATGFEALMGYLYLEHRMERIIELVKYSLEDEEKHA